MQKTIFLLACFMSLLSLNQTLAASTALDGIAAAVNNDVITLSQLDSRMSLVKQQLQQRKIKLPPDNVLSNQVLQMLINQSLEQQTAKRLNITATATDVQQMVHNIAQQQKLTPAQLRASLKKQGLSEKNFITQIKQQIVNQKLLQATIASQISVTPQEIDAGMKMALSQAGVNNEYHLLHILIPLSDSPTPGQLEAAKQKADNIVKQLKKGEDFKSLAAAQSTGKQMFTGGDMGWKTPTELPTVFANVVSTMKKGTIAGPIQTANGFHILKLIGVRGKKLNMTQAQLRQRVQQMIFQRKLQEKQQDWLEQLRASAYIKIYYKPKTLPEPVLQ